MQSDFCSLSLSNIRYVLIAVTVFSLISSQAHYVHAVIVLLSDIAKPLTPEQITELEKDPQFMVNKCVATVEDTKDHSDKLESYEKDQLQLCDNFMSYLQDKCHEFNNLLSYCEVDLRASIEHDEHYVGRYDSARSTQLNCLEDINYGSEYGLSCKEYFSNFTTSPPPPSEMSKFAATLPVEAGTASNATEAVTQAKNLLNMASSTVSNRTDEIINEAEELIKAANEETSSDSTP
jgi:hypothetical protein